MQSVLCQNSDHILTVRLSFVIYRRLQPLCWHSRSLLLAQAAMSRHKLQERKQQSDQLREGRNNLAVFSAVGGEREKERGKERLFTWKEVKTKSAGGLGFLERAE